MNAALIEYQTAGVSFDVKYSHLLDIVEGGPDLSMRMEAAKADFNQFIADLDTHRYESAQQKTQINDAELSGKIDSRTALRQLRELAELVDRKTCETKERLKKRSAELAQFDKEAAVIRWAELKIKEMKRGLLDSESWNGSPSPFQITSDSDC